MALHVNLIVETDEEEENYFRAAARIRGITGRGLVRKLIKIILKDKMVGAILDDIKWEDDNGHSYRQDGE